nr:HU family DNA-binding protein [Amphritea balenae]
MTAELCAWYKLSDYLAGHGPQNIKNDSYKGNNVNKSELIDAIAASADIPKAAAGRALDATLESVSGALQKGDSVALVGFGTFGVKERAARTGRNPQTGQPIQIAAATLPTFKPGKALKDAVNK